MVNLRRKGNRSRLKAIRELEAAGWLVDVVEKTGKFIKIKDCFGLFDLLAVRGVQVLFIQVTTNTPHPHARFEKFAVEHAHNDYLFVQQWVAHDRGDWKKYLYFNDGERRCY